MSQLQADASGSREPLQLMLRPSCMLCLEAEYALSQAGIDRFERIDIERADGFEARYGTRIPVLVRADGAELDWPFNVQAVREFVVLG